MTERILVNIDLKKLEELLKVLEDRQISEFEFEDEKGRVHLKRGQPVVVAPAPGYAMPAPGALPHAAAAAHAAEAKAEADFIFVTSPFVGTFYRSPSPEAPPF